MKISKRERWSVGFYWIGVVMTFATIALVLLGNTKWGAQVEHTSFPLAWKFAIVALLGFVAREICRPPHRQIEKDRDSRHSLDHIPHEI
jgi:hypothetical protein